MSATSVISPNNNIHLKKIHSKLNKIGKININHIVINRNNPYKKIFANKNQGNSLQKNTMKKTNISPFKNLFSKSLSTTTVLNKANYNLKKNKKYYIKSPLSLFKGITPSSTHNIDFTKNIPLLPININKNLNNKVNNNIQRNVEYNSINCIINNFNLSCKNVDTNDDNKKSESIIKFKKYYNIFTKNNSKLKSHMKNLKKNNSVSSYVNNINIKNLSHLSDVNNSNINNITNDNEKTDEINLENKQKQEKIHQRHLENKKKIIYLKELEKKNQRLKNEYQEIKIKHMEYTKSLQRLIRFLGVLQNNGMDINEIMDNISSGEDYDEYIEDDEEDDEDENTDEEEKNEKNEIVLSDGSVLSNLKQLSSGLLRNHDEYSKGSKLKLIKNIPILNICNIKQN